MMNLTRIKAPFILEETEKTAYADPYGCMLDARYCILFTIYDKRSQTVSPAVSYSDNLIYYFAPVKLPCSASVHSIKPLRADKCDNEYRMYFTAEDENGAAVYMSVTSDMIHFSELEKQEKVCADSEERYEKSFGRFSSIIYDNASEMNIVYYCRKKNPSCELGSICIAVSRDKEHYVTFEKDRPTYPDNGVVYEGDYYNAIPFSQYIHDEDIPQGRVFDIRDYGAVADGITLSTEAFRAAAEAARDAGGGVILVAGGYYCMGSVSIYDNTTLFIERDSALCASKDLSKYKDAFVSSVGCKNISIRGGGKIIGNGEYFVYMPLKRPLLEPLPYTKLPSVLYDPMGYPVDTIRYAYRSRIRYNHDRYAQGLPVIKRPMYTLWIRDCDNVILENFIIQDSLDWTLDIDYSRDVKVKDIVINGNRHVANTDGIDVMCSQHVEVEHCFISCADDGLCVKAPKKQGHDDLNIEDENAAMGEASDIHFRNCTVISVMNAFKIGTETYFDISDVSVENCRFMMPDIYPGGVSGISIESSDGSRLSNIRVKDVEMDKICCPLYINLNMRNKFGVSEDRKDRTYGGSVSNIVIENIKAYDAEVPSIISGFTVKADEGVVTGYAENIRVKDFLAVYKDNKEVLDIKTPVYESVTDYPENNGIGDVPAFGFYIRHAQKVALENCKVIPRSMNTREFLVCEDAEVSCE